MIRYRKASMNAPAQVLLVEDEAAHAALMRRAFEAQANQFQLHIVHSLREAYSYLTVTTPDVVFIDFLLPDGRGTDLLPTDSDAVSYPVVILTSNGNEQIAVEALKSGAL